MRGGGPPLRIAPAMLVVVGICWRRGERISGGPPRLPPLRARAWAWMADWTLVLICCSLGAVSSPAEIRETLDFCKIKSFEGF